MIEYQIEMRGISKSFPGVQANDHIDFEVKQNEIHCLLGENGSGKTTLMNILFGINKCDSGEIILRGKKTQINNTKDAHDLGIGMVHQHFMLVNRMSALDNIILGNEPGGIFIDKEAAEVKVKQFIDKFDFQIDLHKLISNMSVGMKQRVEILKILYIGADIIILDEPTAVLTPQEVKDLFNILAELKRDGKTIVFITHKLEETMSISDRVTVLRSGKKIITLPTKTTNEKMLARFMVGHDINFDLERPYTEKGEVVLEVQDLKLIENSQNPVSFAIRKGEIFGIAGVDGNGQLELEEMLMGIQKIYQGAVFLNGSMISKWSTKKIKSIGVGHIPSDRLKRAMINDFTIKENYLLGYQDEPVFNNHGFINQKNLTKYSVEQMKKFNVIAPSEESFIRTLSGGNQQKVIISRELGHDQNLIIVAQPTRGLDIGAIEFVHNTILDLRKQGKAVLLISVELSEIMTLSDRIGVLFKGEIMDIVENYPGLTRERLGLLMAGKLDRN